MFSPPPPTADAWRAYPMGPAVRQWLGLAAADYEGSDAPAPDAHTAAAFASYLVAFAADHPARDRNELLDLMDQLFSMNLPLVVLKLADMHQELWQRDDLRGLMAEGGAAMLANDLARAELCYTAAQALAPTEGAPYVNMVQILHHDERWQEAAAWWEAGLEAEPHNFRLWELVAYHYQKTMSDYLPAFIAYAKKRRSWAGMSLAAELDPLANQQTKSSYLKAFYAEGERSVEFLTEYTGALGMAGAYEEIPAMVWQAEKLNKNAVPWQLELHAAQAQLAMEHNSAFVQAAEKLMRRKDLPESVGGEISKLLQEVQQEGSPSAPH